MHAVDQTAPPGPLVVGGTLLVDPPLFNASGAVDLHSGDPDWRADGSSLAPLGAYVTKTVTLRPRAGHPEPRVELWGAGGLVNAVGLANPGAHVAAREWSRLPGRPFVASIGGSVAELPEVVACFEDADEVDAYELNLSCPNEGGSAAMQASDPTAAATAVAAVVAMTRRPVLAKLSAAADVAAVARAAVAAGAAGLVAVNSLPALALDDTGQPLLGTAACGMSGAPLHPVALRAVQAATGTGVPVIGVGGVASPAGALRMRLAGASAIGIGTAAAMHPSVLAEVSTWLADGGGRHVSRARPRTAV